MRKRLSDKLLIKGNFDILIPQKTFKYFKEVGTSWHQLKI